jgi:hypothetical protein
MPDKIYLAITRVAYKNGPSTKALSYQYQYQYQYR